MRVIVDSGSTKADWAFISDAENQIINTVGFNPVFHNSEHIRTELAKAMPQQYLNAPVSHIHYYGAGCWDIRRKEVIRQALLGLWPNAEIEVAHDLLGAAVAACGTEPGIACIVGTGSNSCLYDGEKVIDNVTNLGYLLGDEASGTHLGKKLIRAYFYREMPPELEIAFEKFFDGDKSTILDKVYGKETPNVYVASFARFLADHRGHPFTRKVLKRSFAEFVDRHVCKYQGHGYLPIHFIGSIAYHFQEELKEVLDERDLHIGIFIKKPIERLVDFHQTNLVS